MKTLHLLRNVRLDTDRLARFIKLTPLAMILLVTLVLLTTAGHCPPPGSPTQSVSANVSLRFFSGGNASCTADIRWEWKPVNLNANGVGQATQAFAIPSSTDWVHYDVPSNPEGIPPTYVCY